MELLLPNNEGVLSTYQMVGQPLAEQPMPKNPSRIIYSAAHVVADPLAHGAPHGKACIDWEDTLKFRHYLAGLGLGIAEAMDTAQRGMGLDWAGALELIKQTRTELPEAKVANGVGTDHLAPTQATSIHEVVSAYMEQLESVQALDARVILMASRALAKLAKAPRDYVEVYKTILSNCDHPVILHWLGEMFDPQLAGYWGADNFEDALEVVLEIIANNIEKIDGIKISLLDKEKEITMRRRLPDSVRMYTGDDFNYPELIEGDEFGFSHALLGIFDPLAGMVARAMHHLDQGDLTAYRATLDPTTPLARHIFRAPTQYYKTGVVFLAWLNGFQNHFIMLNGAQSARSLHDLVETFRLADAAGVLRDPEHAKFKMQHLLNMYGLT